MKYEESEPSEYREREKLDWAKGVHIRQEDRGVMLYAVFDEKTQVSESFGPLNENECISWAEGYSEAKRKYAEPEIKTDTVAVLVKEFGPLSPTEANNIWMRLGFSSISLDGWWNMMNQSPNLVADGTGRFHLTT